MIYTYITYIYYMYYVYIIYIYIYVYIYHLYVIYIYIYIYLFVYINVLYILYIYIYIYIIETMSSPSYHHNRGFVATHAPGHMMNGYTFLVPLNQRVLNKPSKKHNISDHK